MAKRGPKYKVVSYKLPTESPWIVFVNGLAYNVPSMVCRLLLMLDGKKEKVKRPSKSKAKAVKSEDLS